MSLNFALKIKATGIEVEVKMRPVGNEIMVPHRTRATIPAEDGGN
jgi:hypothetical protein